METKNNNYETKNNSGSIFKNNKTKDTQPDYRGKVKVNDKEMEISLWFKESQTGTKYFSASFQEPFVKPTTTEPNVKINNISDDLPF
jgi:uncharacterized protein (DUF736 family)